MELNGGYAHISGDGGLDGYNVGASLWLTHRVSIGFDYDDTWDSSHLGVFELTQTGTIITKSHLQDFLVGPRIHFPGLTLSKEKHIARFLPFAEVELGLSHLRSSLENPSAQISQSASDNAFTWVVGGGADYRFSPHWAARAKLDFLRTHFSDTGQSRARFVVGVMYSFRRMLPTEAEQAAAKQKAVADRKNAAIEAAEARKKEASEQVEREKMAADEAAEAYKRAQIDLAGAEARKKAALEQPGAKEQLETKPDVEAQQFEREKEALRVRLLEHFNRVLPTTDTPCGLVVDMGDVLFDVGKSDIRPEGREALAKLTGIVLNYPSLKLTIEGHTDNVASHELNQTLSEQRANTVRDYLVSQGFSTNSLSAQGLGENNPVGDNNTPEGRQKNRRVEIIVSGEIIGTKIGK